MIKKAYPFVVGENLPDHTQLPFEGKDVNRNFFEVGQTSLLYTSVRPYLREHVPDGRYLVGGDNFVYWQWPADPPINGAIAPDWFLILGVEPELPTGPRRSYVLWQERVSPLIALEYVSGDGTEEYDRTPNSGKMWIYEQRVRARYYGIYDPLSEHLEVFHLEQHGYRRMNTRASTGRYLIQPLRLELGIWHGRYDCMQDAWLRFWDQRGELLPIVEEEKARADRERRRANSASRRARAARRRADQEKERADQEKERAEKLAEKLRQLGIDPESVGDTGQQSE